MLTVTEARSRILAAARTAVPVKHLPLAETLGCVLADEICSNVDVPPCDNSAMDGYAVRAAECAAGSLPVSAVNYAGAMPGVLQPGTAQRIFTGAPVPAGADAVVIQEDVIREGDDVMLREGIAVAAGDNIRRAGEDIRAGERLLLRGLRLRAQHLGLLASVGLAQVPVYASLRVGLLSTGDELLEPGEPVQPGKIYNSNRYLLAGLLRDLHCAVVDAGRVGDNLDTTSNALRELAAKCDVVISTGGVSVGDADHVKQAVQANGTLDLWKIAVKPGKPLAFGDIDGKPFFGLPGNPVSAYVTFQLFVRPFLQVAQGGNVEDLREVAAVSGFAWPKPGKREEYLQVTLQQQNGVLVATALPNQGSGVLSSVCRADALLRVPVGTVFAPGETVSCLLL